MRLKISHPGCLDLLRLTLDWGKFFVITPASSHLGLHIQLAGGCLLFLLTSTGTAFAIQSKFSYYLTLKQIKLVLKIITDLVLAIFVIYSVGVGMYPKRKKWANMMIMLKATSYRKLPPTVTTIEVYHHLKFVVVQFGFIILLSYVVWDMRDLVLRQWVRILTLYYQLYYIKVGCLSIAAILSRYNHLNVLLSQQLGRTQKLKYTTNQELIKILGKVENQLFLLKETVDLASDLYGWPILLVTFHAGLLLLDYLDDVFNGATSYLHKSELGVLLVFVVGAAALIVLCGELSEQLQQIIIVMHGFQMEFSDETSSERKLVDDFVNMVQFCAPNFVVGGLIIDKRMCLDVLGTVFTYLIVTVQLKTPIMN